MFEIRQTFVFSSWFAGLKDGKARSRIVARIDRLALGNPGDVRPVGSGVSEMRVDYGPGYRIYYFKRSNVVIVLLAGGDKRTQKLDIARAIALAQSEKQ